MAWGVGLAPAEPVRVACVGDSITFGAGLQPGQDYPAQLQNMLGTNWDVRNFGVSARTLLRKGDFPYWRESAFTNAQAFQPNVVVILLGANDSKPHNWKYHDEFAGDYTDLVKVFRNLASKPSIYVCRPTPVPEPGNYGINEAVEQEQIKQIDRLADTMKLEEIDLYSPLQYQPQFFPDRVHPNADGAAVMARVVCQALQIRSAVVTDRKVPIASGPFKPDWNSLTNYQCPEWFRDAKFGIWAHWNAQSVPEMGDWYARYMYCYGGRENKYHVANYGHPSKFGFKDIDNLWHAENWNPEKLMSLYKKAGAQYFVALANHHDNFDCWDSKYQPWNSVRVGPHKDIVGGWARAARAVGLRFGVSLHASHAWSWMEPSQGADNEGPLAGVPYDGKLTQADGKGLWWEGLDPQDLYAQNHPSGTNFDWYWSASKGSSIPDQAYCDRYYNRTLDLMDKYHPDIMYFDDSPIPLWPVSDVGLRIAAHYYNSSMQWHGGQNEAVMTGKNLVPGQDQCMVHDMERGKMPGIHPLAWQTDTCIGEWQYSRELFDKHGYKKASEVISMLADIVSKNGNLLLAIPLHADGTPDADALAFLKEMTAWMKVNHESIFSTRPWKVYGEGPSTTADSGKGISEGQADVAKTPFTAQDIRFTQTKDGKTVYAIVLGWPTDGKLVVKSLAAKSPNYQGEVGAVRLLGSRGKLTFTRDEAGMTVAVPGKKPCENAWVLKISLR